MRVMYCPVLIQHLCTKRFTRCIALYAPQLTLTREKTVKRFHLRRTLCPQGNFFPVGRPQTKHLRRAFFHQGTVLEIDARFRSVQLQDLPVVSIEAQTRNKGGMEVLGSNYDKARWGGVWSCSWARDSHKSAPNEHDVH